MSWDEHEPVILLNLYKGGPFWPKDNRDLQGLRDELAELGMQGPEAEAEWHTTLKVMADELAMTDSLEQWIARWDWGLQTASHYDRGQAQLFTYRVHLEMATPRVFYRAAEQLVESANETVVLGWTPNQLKLKFVDGRFCRLGFTVMRERAARSAIAETILPGGFAGLAWLYFKLLGKER